MYCDKKVKDNYHPIFYFLGELKLFISEQFYSIDALLKLWFENILKR